MKIIFDFDHCLFSTKRFNLFFEKTFLKLGIKKEDFRETFQKAKGKEKVYRFEKHLRLLQEKYPFLPRERLIQQKEKVFKKLSQFLYPDVKDFLKKWSKKADLFIISFGDKKFQREKIESCGISHFFKEIIVTKSKVKSRELKGLFKKEERIFFIEDNLAALIFLKKKFKKLITVRLNRKEGKYKDLPDSEEIDFSIKNLKELDEILEKIKEKPKALVLFSGGLDSILAALFLKKQKIKVVGITFTSYFFGPEKAKEAAKKIGIFLKIVDFSKEHLKVVKKPKYGYGKSMNPCIDCHILMLKKAKEVMEKENFDFVATGEVLGERPMSQNREALEIVEKESSLKGYLLRPLSARLLPKTIPEKLLLVDREKLLDIKGRSRKRQIELAKEFKIKEYPTPAGGCLLTDLEFGKRLKKLFEIFPGCQGNDIELLKLGRHFWEGKVKIIVGRNEKENEEIKKLIRKGDILIEMKNYPGPTTLIRNYGKRKNLNKIIEKAKKLTQFYSRKSRGKKDINFKALFFT